MEYIGIAGVFRSCSLLFPKMGYMGYYYQNKEDSFMRHRLRSTCIELDFGTF
jgi:hypothetical protein